MNASKQKTNGFTLIELLVVMSVAAVLGTIGLTIGRAVLDRVHIFKDKTTLALLTFAYADARDNGYINTDSSIGDIILCLARDEGINNTSLYHSSARLRNKSQKITTDQGEIATKRIVSDFVMVYNLPPDANPETTPAFYSAGLKEDGTWGENGAYHREGGLIAFLSGDVRFVRNANEVLVSRKTGQPTGSIYEALPEGSVIANVFTLKKK